MWWIMAIAVGVPLLIILLLTIPVNVFFRFDSNIGWEPRLRLTWLFGFVIKEFNSRTKKTRKASGWRRKQKGVNVLWTLVRSGKSRGTLFRLIKGVLSRLHIRQAKLDLRVGLNDPMETGMLFAAIYPMMSCINTFAPVQLQVQPDFSRSGLWGYGEVNVRVIPLTMLRPFADFVFSPAGLRIMKTIRL